MKKKILHIHAVVLCLGVSLTTLLSSCLKKTDLDIKPSTGISFADSDLVKAMQGESSVQLFYQAFNRLSLASSITNDKGFTIFAPTDSAMKAAGLDASVISSLPLDSLRKLVLRHITSGAYADPALSNNVTATQVPTLQSSIVTSPTGGQSVVYAALFVKEQDGFYFNGVKVNKSGAVISASNGYLYKIDALITNLPTETLYDFISADSDLSMYKDAITIADSVRYAAFGLDDGTGMVAMLSNMPAASQAGMLPTVLVPTNKAFRDAGFNNADDLRNLATRYYVGYDFSNGFVFMYSSLDSVLQHHVMYNLKIAKAATTQVRVFYNDLTTTAINNNVYNIFSGFIDDPTLSLNLKVPLTFSTTGNNVNVRWTNDPAAPSVPLVHDTSPLHPVNNFIASNGALYKIDQLFYPVVN